MKKFYIAIIAIVVIAGGLTAWRLNSNSRSNSSNTKSSSQMQTTSMSAMQKQFEGYKGTEYDKVFLAAMIVHHQGAVQMAQMALTTASHQELKDMANNIITAQNSEISQMQSWQTAWGYSASDSTTQAAVKQMQSEMDSMMSQLNGKTGEDFDKAFLTEMMMHHQSAIDMSKPAATNASHAEVKTLASNIITAQTKEVNQMMQWQTQWGYKMQSSSSDNMSGMSM